MIRERNGMILRSNDQIEIDDAAKGFSIALRVKNPFGSSLQVDLTLEEAEHLIIELRGAIERAKAQEQS